MQTNSLEQIPDNLAQSPDNPNASPQKAKDAPVTPMQATPTKTKSPAKRLGSFSKINQETLLTETAEAQGEEYVIIQMPKNPLEDRPLKGSSGNYNLEKLDQMKDDYVPSKRTPVKKPEIASPIAKNENKEDEGQKGSNAKNQQSDLNLGEEQERPLKASSEGFSGKKPSILVNNKENEEQLFDFVADKPLKPKPERFAKNQKPAKTNESNPVPEEGQPTKKAEEKIEEPKVSESPAKKSLIKIPNSQANPETQGPGEERPIGSKTGGYNLDNLDQIQDNYVPSKKAPVKKPEPVSEDRPLGSKTRGYNLDDLEKMQDNYVPSKKAQVKKPEPPAPPKPQTESEDRPLGSKTGGYNFDNMEEQEKNYKPSSKASQIKKPAEPQEQPIGQTKGPIPKEDPIPADEEKPIGGGQKLPANLKDEMPEGADGVDADATLEGRLKNPNFAVKMQAYEDVLKWQDDSVTPESFCKTLHFTVKEKHPQIIDKILGIIEDIIANQQAAWQTINFKQFLVNFAEHTMSNVKGPSKDHCMAIIPTLWGASKKEEFLATLKDEMLKKPKIKLQENSLTIVLELVKAGKIEELGYFKPVKEELENLVVSRSVSLKNLTMGIYKEAFLWLGEAIKAFITGLKKPQLDELEAYFKTVDPSQMKLLKKNDGGGKGKALDVYDMVSEIELPKKFNDESWVDEVLACAKWNEKKAKIDELNDFLAKAPKLSSKTNSFNFLNLARRLFMETNVAVQVSVIKTLGFLAAALRKNFVTCSKTLLPILLGKLKEKHKSLSEEIIATIEKFYTTLTFEETHDDILDHMKDKNNDKKLNMLKVLSLLVEKLDKIKNPQSAVKMVKLVIGLLDENDSSVRDGAAQLIAKLKDNFNDKVTPLLSDLSSVKLSKITNFCTNQSTVISSNTTTTKNAQPETTAKTEEQPDKNANARRNIASMSKDKSQMIAEMRENLFSNKTIKVSDVKAFSGYLNTTLKNLLELTKEFKEVSSSQAKEILVLIQEIANRVDKNAFPEDSRKIIILFYIEQLLGKSGEETFESMDQLIYHHSKIVSPKTFLADIFDVVVKRSIKVSRELLVAILKIIDKEVIANSQLALLPHKQFIDFLKINFTGQSIHSSFKAPLLNTIKAYGKKFGDKSLNDFPSALIKELESQSGEAQKAFVRTFDKLNDKNPEKKKAALAELANYDDPAKILLFWTNNDFLSFLKRSLLMDIRGPNYASLLAIVSRYLALYKECPHEFSMKSYLFAFHSILTHYFDKKEGHKYSQEFEALIRSSISTLGATSILNEFISDANALGGWKEQILNFFFSFSNEIEINIRFMNYLISLVGQKGPANEIRPLVDSVLLLLKSTTDDEIILKGNENKYIREVWQKNEEDLLINENFIKGHRVFEESRTYQVVKGFIMETLKIEESGFYAWNLEQFGIAEGEANTKIKLAYFYLRSIENIPRMNEFFVGQFSKIDWASLDNISLFIGLKLIFQILKNLFYMQNEEIFLTAKDTFETLLQRIPFSFEEMYKILDLSSSEASFFSLLVNNEEQRMYEEREHPTPAKANPRVYPPSMINDFPAPTQPAQKDAFRNTSQNRKFTAQVANPQTDSEALTPGYNRDNWNQNSPKSQISNNKRAVQNTSAKPQRNKEPSVDRKSQVNYQPPAETAPGPNPAQNFAPTELENPMILQEKFAKMLSYNLEEFNDASEYFKGLCRTENPNTLKFLHLHANDIISVFVEVSSMVFQEGINYELERSSYELIFVPFQQLCAVDQLLTALQQPVLNNLVELVLFRLVSSNEEKTLLEQNEEEQGKQDLAGFMVKFWNSVMLRVIENADPNMLLTALFLLIVSAQDFETNRLHQSIYNLAFKCIIRITRNLKNIITKIDPRVVLNLIFNYIQTFGVKNSESLGSKSVKTLLNELVNRSDPDFVWACYAETFGEQGEPNISKWIRIIQARNGKEVSRVNNPQELERELYEIIQEINKQARISQIAVFMNDIRRILDEEPSIDIRNFADAFANKAYFEFVAKELKLNKTAPQGSLNNTFNNGNQRQNSAQGMANFNSTSALPNTKQALAPGQVQGQSQQRQPASSTKKSPLNARKTKNMDEVLNQSDISDASQLFKKAEGKSRYNFN